jgi:hypothetical protein
VHHTLAYIYFNVAENEGKLKPVTDLSEVQQALACYGATRVEKKPGPFSFFQHEKKLASVNLL